jgi:cyclic pyranopterin phosphate synthase
MTKEQGQRLTHINDNGAAMMVDVGLKEITRREASACARISMSVVALDAIRSSTLQKGEAIGTARIAGIMAAKKVSDLIPLCHSLPISAITIAFTFEDTGLLITSSVVTDAKTGVEMEALTACSVSALTIYDMAKAVDRSMVISDIKLLSKSGGKSGSYHAEE